MPSTHWATKARIKIAGILIIAVFVGFPLMTQGASAIVFITKEFGLDIVARLIASNVLNKLSQSVINIANNKGREGGAVFVSNWREFVVKSAQRGENVFRSQLAYSINNKLICPGTEKVLGEIFNTKYGDIDFTRGGNIGQLGKVLRNNIDLFQTKTKCTIPIQIYEDFSQDFKKGGGWETWLRIIQPQNNAYGLLAMSLAELDNQREIERMADEGETRSSGFLGKHDACEGVGIDAKCSFFGKTLTPANILGESAAKTIDSKFDWLTSSDELSEVIVALVVNAINHLNNYVMAKTSGIADIGDIDFSAEERDIEAQRLEGANAANQGRINSCIDSCSQTSGSSCDPSAMSASAYASCKNNALRACQSRCR